MKVGTVVRGLPVLPTLAVFLLLPIGRARAADWEGDFVLGEDGGNPGVSVLEGEPPAEAADTAMAGPMEPFSAGQGEWQPAMQPRACEPAASHEFLPCRGRRADACWSFRSEALVLWRNAPASRPLFSKIVPGNPPRLGATALDANDLNSDVLVAPRLSLFRTSGAGRTLEATYFYAGNFYSDRTLPFLPNGYGTSPPGIDGNEWIPTVNDLDSASAKLLGQLQSLEFNSRHCLWPETCQFLIGARWLQWNESSEIKDFYTYTEPRLTTGRDLYETRCFNNLWGGQIGLDTLVLGRPGMSRVEGLVKAGAYYNNAGQHSSYDFTLNGTPSFEGQARAGGPATCSFVGEVGLTAVLPISCHCDFRCGYSGLWLTNLAQPTRQLSEQTIVQGEPVVAGLDTNGSLILQGLSLGLESRW